MIGDSRWCCTLRSVLRPATYTDATSAGVPLLPEHAASVAGATAWRWTERPLWVDLLSSLQMEAVFQELHRGRTARVFAM